MALIITAPVKGWAAPLEEVPDPVFAERMMGDGVAIHPLGDTIHRAVRRRGGRRSTLRAMR